MELNNLTIRELMLLYRQISVELRDRSVCRTGNSPTGDIAEHLFSQCFGWTLEANSKAGYDARCPKLGRIQIKSRFLSFGNASRQAGDIRKLDENAFDWLAGVVFSPRAEIELGVLIPHSAVKQRALSISSMNSSRIYLRGDWLALPIVKDVTSELASCWHKLNH